MSKMRHALKQLEGVIRNLRAPLKVEQLEPRQVRQATYAGICDNWAATLKDYAEVREAPERTRQGVVESFHIDGIRFERECLNIIHRSDHRQWARHYFRMEFIQSIRAVFGFGL